MAACSLEFDKIQTLPQSSHQVLASPASGEQYQPEKLPFGPSATIMRPVASSPTASALPSASVSAVKMSSPGSSSSVSSSAMFVRDVFEWGEDDAVAGSRPLFSPDPAGAAVTTAADANLCGETAAAERGRLSETLFEAMRAG